MMRYVLIAGLFLFYVHGIARTPIYYVSGYEDAGKYIACNPRGKSVLYYGNYDGAFMAGIRRHISKGGPYVLRGDRQLAIRTWWGELKDVDSPKSIDAIIKFLNEYQTGYVVVERDMPRAKDYKEYVNLLKTLANDIYFQQVASFPIRTNYKKLGAELLVYQFNFTDTLEGTKTLRIPVSVFESDIEIEY